MNYSNDMIKKTFQMLALLLPFGIASHAQNKEDQLRSTGFPIFPKIVNSNIPGAPILGQPILITGYKQEIRTEKHGLAYPAFYDWNGDGKTDLLLGEFETGDTVSNIKVYLNEGTARSPKYSGKYQYAKDIEGHRIANHQWCCIGIHPRFVDLDGDGKLDILSGQYNPGLISLWRGSAKGFHAREYVPQEGYQAGKRLEPIERNQEDPNHNFYWNYTSANFADFNGDGLPDLFIGGAANLRVALNTGTAAQPKFGLRKFLLGLDGYPVRAYPTFTKGKPEEQLFSMPDFTGLEKSFVTPVDWDGDGILDLLVTHSYASSKEKDPILFFKGVNTDKGLRFENAKPLLETDKLQKLFPGCQPNITVTDYNHDGIPDIVFGISLPTVEGFKIDSLTAWSYLHDINIETPGKDAGRAFEYEPGGMEGLTKKVKEDANYKRYFLGKLDDLKYLTLRHRGYVYVMLGKKNPLAAEKKANVKAAAEVRVVNEKVVSSKADGPVNYSIKSPGIIKFGNEAQIEIAMNIQEGWYGYVNNAANEKLGFMPTKVQIELPEGFEKVGEIISPTPSVKGAYQVYQGDNLKFIQKIKLKNIKALKNGQSYPVKVIIDYQTCNHELCLPPVQETEELSILFKY